MKFLYAAYGVTWLVHIVYLIILTRGFQQVRDEAEELTRK